MGLIDLLRFYQSLTTNGSVVASLPSIIVIGASLFGVDFDEGKVTEAVSLAIALISALSGLYMTAVGKNRAVQQAAKGGAQRIVKLPGIIVPPR